MHSFKQHTWLTPDIYFAVANSVAKHGLKILDQARKARLLFAKGDHTFGDNDFTIREWAGDTRYDYLEGVHISGHSDGHTYLYLWGIKDGCEVFHIRISEKPEADMLKYLDGRDHGYILSMVNGGVLSDEDSTTYFPLGSSRWTILSMPDIRQDVSWLLRFALEEHSQGRMS